MGCSAAKILCSIDTVARTGHSHSQILEPWVQNVGPVPGTVHPPVNKVLGEFLLVSPSGKLVDVLPGC